jgi:hypothetical protein
MAPEYSEEDVSGMDDIDLEELAEKIVALLLQEIAIEIERTGR